MQRVCILGATGSIGTSALDVIARHPERFTVTALTAHNNVAALAALCQRFRPQLAVIGDARHCSELSRMLKQLDIATEVMGGAEGLQAAAQSAAVDVVVAAIVGAAGLMPTIAAARAGKRLLLANKESVVCAGALLMQAVHEGGGGLIPVDSEHSAIHQCLAGAYEQHKDVRRLILTASGGPFRTRQDLSGITPEQACAHPNWVMGRKISVDSATLMNKGLEVIEASWLFSFAADRIDVVVHPQSVIHSMVEFVDGSVVSQLGTPDMRTPIAYALGYPQRIEAGSGFVDFNTVGSLTFEAPDAVRFPCLRLAYDALRAGPAATIVLNTANEVAVDAFLNRRLAFTAIAEFVGDALATHQELTPSSIDEVLAIDARTRRRAQERISVVA